MKNLSISQRLKKCKNQETRREIISEWVSEWVDDMEGIIDRMRKAEQHRDWSAMSGNIAQLIAGNKKLNALQSIFETLLETKKDE